MIQNITFIGTEIVGSSLILGTWGIGGPNDISGNPLGWPKTDDSEAASIIDAAIDVGINTFDTAGLYGRGRSEEILGKSLYKRRSRFVIATKGGILPRMVGKSNDLDRDFSPSSIIEAVEKSLLRLKTDYLDIFQLHGPTNDIVGREDTWNTLEKLKLSGKIRCVGVSLRGEDAKKTTNPWWIHKMVQVVQTPYSPATIREIKAVEEIRHARLKVNTTLARSVFHHGLLLHPRTSEDFTIEDHRRNKWSAKFAEKVRAFWLEVLPDASEDERVRCLLDFALSSPAIDGVIIGATSPDQIEKVIKTNTISTFSQEWRDRILRSAESHFG